MKEPVGEQIGNYHLVRLLGQGGFADVYLGEHIHLHTQAAIKILQMQLVQDNAEAFIHEARTVAHLIHPNIVRVLDFGIHNNVPFLVMDYAPGGTLRQQMPKGKPLPPATLFPFLAQVASALQYAHDRKLIHRDVKPENMLIGISEILLSDFGLALITQSIRSHPVTNGGSDITGTPTYMAPEQIQGKPQQASDQYALGVVVFEWLTGTRPYQGTFLEVATQQVLAPTPSLQAKVPTISPAIEEVVMRAMAKDPQQRYPSVQDFATALAQVCVQEGLISKEVTQVVKTSRHASSPAVQGPSPLGNSSQLTYLPSRTNLESQPTAPINTSPNATVPMPTESSADQSVEDNDATKIIANPLASQLNLMKTPPPVSPEPALQDGQLPISGQGNMAATELVREQKRMNRLLMMISLLLICMLVLGGGTGIWLFWPDASTPPATPVPASPTTIPHATPIPTSTMISNPTPDVAPTPTPDVVPTPTPDVAPTPTPDVVPTPTPTPDTTSTPTPDVTPTPDSNQMLNP